MSSEKMYLADDMQKMSYWNSQAQSLTLLLLWYALHFVVSLWYLALAIARALEGYLISFGLVKRYKSLDISKVKYLAIVIDSEEAKQTSKVIKLLRWLAGIGIKYVCLYDSEGVLKKSKETILKRLSNAKLYEETTKNDSLDKKHMHVEFASFSDGKEAVAKAANLLLVKYYSSGDPARKSLTESVVAEALRAIGSGGPEPDLLLIYGPARCHLGFPAWRMRYTEIVHMGSLKSMRYGSLIKTIYKFTMVRQNYGK